MNNKAIFNWSGGKDSALALYRVLQEEDYKVEILLTSVNTSHQRISMHGVRETLLEQQAICIGIPLKKVQLPEQLDMKDYNQLMEKMMMELKKEGFKYSIFGDIFLEDLKKYREEQLNSQGFLARFPIWKEDTRKLIQEFLNLGFKTIVVCVNSEMLDKSFAGRVINEKFLRDLPDNVDPCGENGEFHTFVFDGPIFKNPISFDIGEKIYREYNRPKNEMDSNKGESQASTIGFWFCDLVAKNS